MKTVAIVGFGRFGKILYRLIKDDFRTIIVHRDSPPKEISQADVVFYCVPIAAFEKVIVSHKSHLRNGQLLIDVLSVKMHPKHVFEKHLKGSAVQAMLTHPMFGPDSSKEGFVGLPIVMDRFTASNKHYLFWKDYFSRKGLRVVAMSAKEHDRLYDKLLPKRVDPRRLIFGIQGGKGSFNEEAILFYTKKNKIRHFKIRYLYTTERVLRHLHEGRIDFGQFAIQNAVGGVVQESTHAMARYRFRIVEEFEILIRHALMARKGIRLDELTAIMGHPQNFRQCKDTLAENYPRLRLVSGQGDLIDTAAAARALAQGRVPETTAILGPKILASIYGFDILNEDLQDSKENYTTFFLVKR